MWTINYKGFYIHGYNDKPDIFIFLDDRKVIVKSINNAKNKIRSYLKNVQNISN